MIKSNIPTLLKKIKDSYKELVDSETLLRAEHKSFIDGGSFVDLEDYTERYAVIREDYMYDSLLNQDVEQLTYTEKLKAIEESRLILARKYRVTTVLGNILSGMNIREFTDAFFSSNCNRFNQNIPSRDIFDDITEINLEFGYYKNELATNVHLTLTESNNKSQNLMMESQSILSLTTEGRELIK